MRAVSGPERPVIPAWVVVTARAAGIAAAVAAVLIVAIGVVLWRHIRRCTLQCQNWQAPRYDPHSADLRGRWRVSGRSDDPLGDNDCVLNTDPDPPGKPLPPPLHRPGQPRS
uniref:hypothetical protein n=1 Tax=Amycolatopsis sp. CA-096443 TaxID=3239919 RepID=UPI003F4932A4